MDSKAPFTDPNKGTTNKATDERIELEHAEGEVRCKTKRTDEDARDIEGDAHFHTLDWKRLTIVLIVQSIALGTLSIPAAFATLGMVAGVSLTIVFGFLAIYASYIVGLVKLKYPHSSHYADFGQLLMGRFGDRLFSSVFVALLTLVIGSHCLTGQLALATISDSAVCSLVFSVLSAVILFAFAIPPSFAELSFLGYFDFASIIIAIGTSIFASGLQKDRQAANTSFLPWSPWPKDNLMFSEAFIAVSNIVFAYAFAAAQPSFMDEMHTPKDFTKSIYALGIAQMTIYTTTGGLLYAFIGQGVESPALLSAGPLISRVAFGIALPVIFISGSINITVACRFIHGRIFRNSVIRCVNTPKGWVTWLALVALITLISWAIAEAIPFFSELLSICGCLFVSGFSLYIPPVMWFFLLKEGSWLERKNLRSLSLNLVVFLVGICVLICGTYASINGVITKFETGSLSKPFSCESS